MGLAVHGTPDYRGSMVAIFWPPYYDQGGRATLEPLQPPGISDLAVAQHLEASICHLWTVALVVSTSIAKDNMASGLPL